MASSSSAQARSIVSPKLYDVFISHRGPDVKETLAKQFYDLLEARGYKAFLDREELEDGDSITSAIDNAICSSRVPIAIFSKGYAQSYWCLDELLLMLQQTDALFIPVSTVFSHGSFVTSTTTSLSMLQHLLIMKGNAGILISWTAGKRRLHLLQKYLDTNLASIIQSMIATMQCFVLSGIHHVFFSSKWHSFLPFKNDFLKSLSVLDFRDLCKKIVSRVVQVMEKSIPLHVAKYPVGLDELVQDFEMCCSKTAESVGIFVLGGSGKTTLAIELFNKKRPSYDASCFLSDVRESHGRGQLHSLQKKALETSF